MLQSPGMSRIQRTFRPEVVTTIRMFLLAGLAGAFLMTFAWGYEGRQQARRWREVACTNRVSDLTRVLPGLSDTGAPCETLQRIGMTVVR